MEDKNSDGKTGFEGWFEENNRIFVDSFNEYITGEVNDNSNDLNEKIKEAFYNSVKSWENFINTKKDKSVDIESIFTNVSLDFDENLNKIKKYINIFNDSNLKYGEGLGSGADNLFNFIKNIYDNEISKIFAFPKLGIGRSYQEKINLTLDKYLKFQTTVYEFLYLLYVPFEQTLDFIRNNAEFSSKLTLEDDKIYEKWLALLEKNYMNLFHSEKYNKVLSDTIIKLSEFRKSRNEVLHDYLKVFGVPVNKDMDDLYKEIYNLKKRIQKLEKGS